MIKFFKKLFHKRKNIESKEIKNTPIVFEDEQGKDVVLQIRPNGNDSLFEIINLKDNNSIIINKEQCILVATALFEYGKTGKITNTLKIISQ